MSAFAQKVAASVISALLVAMTIGVYNMSVRVAELVVRVGYMEEQVRLLNARNAYFHGADSAPVETAATAPVHGPESLDAPTRSVSRERN